MERGEEKLRKGGDDEEGGRFGGGGKGIRKRDQNIFFSVADRENPGLSFQGVSLGYSWANFQFFPAAHIFTLFRVTHSTYFRNVLLW
jgi:hypothetical protein